MTLEELNRHVGLIQELEWAQETLASLRAAAQPGAAKLTGMPRSSAVSDKVGDLAVEIADLETEIAALTARLAEEEAPIDKFIRSIPDAQTRMVFRLRFLRGLSWKEVSQTLGRFTSEASVKSVCYRWLQR